MSAAALASDSAFVSPPNSASSQPRPRGAAGHPADECRTNHVSTSWSSIPSRPMGPASSTSITWSAASKTDGYPEHQERPCGRTVHQPQRGFQDHHARRLGADQGLGHVESFFRQQIVQRITGNSPRNLAESARRISSAYLSRKAQACRRFRLSVRRPE